MAALLKPSAQRAAPGRTASAADTLLPLTTSSLQETATRAARQGAPAQGDFDSGLAGSGSSAGKLMVRRFIFHW